MSLQIFEKKMVGQNPDKNVKTCPDKNPQSQIRPFSTLSGVLTRNCRHMAVSIANSAYLLHMAFHHGLFHCQELFGQVTVTSDFTCDILHSNFDHVFLSTSGRFRL